MILNQVVGAISNAADSVSGIATEQCGPVVTTAIGRFTVQCTAIDRAGNSARGSTEYRVAYRLQRFNSPLIGPPTVNQVSNGLIIPFRFRLVDANGAPVAGLRPGHFGFFVEAASMANCTNGAPNPISETTTNHALRHLGDGNYEGAWIAHPASGNPCFYMSADTPVEKADPVPRNALVRRVTGPSRTSPPYLRAVMLAAHHNFRVHAPRLGSSQQQR